MLWVRNPRERIPSGSPTNWFLFEIYQKRNLNPIWVTWPSTRQLGLLTLDRLLSTCLKSCWKSELGSLCWVLSTGLSRALYVQSKGLSTATQFLHLLFFSSSSPILIGSSLTIISFWKQGKFTTLIYARTIFYMYEWGIHILMLLRNKGSRNSSYITEPSNRIETPAL